MMYDPLASYSSMSSFFIRFPSADRDQVREPVLVGAFWTINQKEAVGRLHGVSQTKRVGYID